MASSSLKSPDLMASTPPGGVGPAYREGREGGGMREGGGERREGGGGG